MALKYDSHLGMHNIDFYLQKFFLQKKNTKKMKNDCYLTVKQWDNIFVMKFL